MSASGSLVRTAPAETLARSTGPKPELILDLSRLLSRVLRPTPTGIDRVEMAYAVGLTALAGDRLGFAAHHPSGHYGHLPARDVRAFLAHTQARWEDRGHGETAARTRAQALHWLWRLRPRAVRRPERGRVLLHVSPNALDRPGRIATRIARERGKLICMVHDLIPLTHPEFARPGGAARHHARMTTLARHASGIIANSKATQAALLDRYGDTLGETPVRALPLGVTPARAAPPAAGRHPYFVALGTIEPRKNHLLLLSVWRSLVERLGADHVPHLHLIGRRGWENEQVLDLLERCTALRPVVFEQDRLPDRALHALIADARALLMPSFAEGFGLPIAEALAAGVPVIASDLPAHREAGGAVPDYLDPLDGLAWRSAVLGYAGDADPRRPEQLKRLSTWAPPSWDAHLGEAMAFAEEIAGC